MISFQPSLCRADFAYTPIPSFTGKVDKGLEEIIFQLLDSGIF